MFCCQRSLLNLAFCRGNLNGLIGSAKGGSVVGAVNCKLSSRDGGSTAEALAMINHLEASSVAIYCGCGAI
jgi:hypothetical protein